MTDDVMADEARFVDLLWPVVPRNDVDGALDWVSGIMMLDALPEHFRDIDNAPPEIQLQITRAWTHETFHYQQFSTLGFMYEWAAELALQFRSVIMRSGLMPLDFAKVKGLLRGGSSLLEPAERESLHAHYSKLDAPSRSGLTARAIFEGHAYFVERRALHPIYKCHQWTPHLQQAPAAIYRVAFDVLSYVIGHEMAFEWFAAVAAVSLCCGDPADAFDRLAFVLARSDLSELVDATRRFQFLEVEVGVELRTPLQRRDKPHTLFMEAAGRVAAAGNAGYPIHEFFIAPHLHVHSLAYNYDLQPPIIFKPLPKGQLAIRAPEGADRAAIFALFSVGAVGKRLLHDIEHESQLRGDAALEQLSWLARDPGIVVLELAPEDLHNGDPTRMANLLAPSKLSTALWGRVMLSIPKELGGRDVLLPNCIEARRLIAAIHRRVPAFAAYLDPKVGGFFEWFGSLAPEDALTDDGLDVADERVIELARGTADAIDRSAREFGLNAWLVIQRLLLPYFDDGDIDDGAEADS